MIGSKIRSLLQKGLASVSAALGGTETTALAKPEPEKEEGILSVDLIPFEGRPLTKDVVRDSLLPMRRERHGWIITTVVGFGVWFFTGAAFLGMSPNTNPGTRTRRWENDTVEKAAPAYKEEYLKTPGHTEPDARWFSSDLEYFASKKLAASHWMGKLASDGTIGFWSACDPTDLAVFGLSNAGLLLSLGTLVRQRRRNPLVLGDPRQSNIYLNELPEDVGKFLL